MAKTAQKKRALNTVERATISSLNYPDLDMSWLTTEEAVREIRSVREAGGFIGNMLYIDKLLEDYDAQLNCCRDLQESNGLLLKRAEDAEEALAHVKSDYQDVQAEITRQRNLGSAAFR